MTFYDMCISAVDSTRPPFDYRPSALRSEQTLFSGTPDTASTQPGGEGRPGNADAAACRRIRASACSRCHVLLERRARDTPTGSRREGDDPVAKNNGWGWCDGAEARICYATMIDSRLPSGGASSTPRASDRKRRTTTLAASVGFSSKAVTGNTEDDEQSTASHTNIWRVIFYVISAKPRASELEALQTDPTRARQRERRRCTLKQR